MVADDEVADPAERDPEREPDHRAVHHLEERVVIPAEQRDVDQDRAGDPAEQREPTVPERQHVGHAVELGEVTDHEEQTRADDRADQRPEHHRVDVLDAHPALGSLVLQDPRAEQEPHGDPDAVRADREVAEQVDPIEDRPADRGEHGASLSAVAVERGGHGLAEQDPAGHVGGEMHADVDA